MRFTTMKLVFLIVYAVVLGQSAANSCFAVPSLALSSSPLDLSQVTPGTSLTLSVSLSGLEVGDELDSLGATVVFNPLLLGEPVISNGEIIPDSLGDLFDFLSLDEPGVADAAFSTFSTDAAYHITENGIFFSFTVQALGPGSGSISLEFVDGTLFNLADPASPIRLEIAAGPAISFTVVPEPSSAALAALALLLIAWWKRVSVDCCIERRARQARWRVRWRPALAAPSTASRRS